MFEYIYAIWAGFFLIIWTALFFLRKDLSHEMFLISFLFGIGGIISEATHIQDWWQPITITHTKIGPEDFLIGFAIGGIAAVIYEEIYKKHLSKRKIRLSFCPHPVLFLILSPLVFLILFFFFHISSFYSSVITFLSFTFWMLFKRKDLISDSIVSGILMLILGIGTYFLLFLVDNNFIKEYWYLKKSWYSTLFFGIPLAEYIWYFLAGAFIGPLYEFVKRSKLKSESHYIRRHS